MDIEAETKILMKEAQDKRQTLVSQAQQMRAQAEKFNNDANSMLLEVNKIDGKIEGFTILLDKISGAKPEIPEKAKKKCAQSL